MKEISKFKIVILSLTDFSDAIFTGIIASYLMYYFLPSDSSGIITLLPQATLSFAVVKAIGTFFDFFVDIIISKFLDRRKSGKFGRRIPIMKTSLIALILSTSLVFFVPFQEVSIWNALWLGFFLIVYYTSFSLYYVSYYALEQELVPAGKKRNYTYMVSAITYFFGTIVVILIPGIKDLLVDLGFSVMNSWKMTIFGASILAVFMANRTSMKKQLCIASAFCCLAFSNILLAPILLKFISGTALMIIYYGCLIYPYAAFSVFPYVVFADIAEYDRKKNNKHRSGFHCALQNFSFKFSQSFAFIVIPFVIKIGASPGSNVSKIGLYGSAIVCLFFSIITLSIFIKYQELDLNYNNSDDYIEVEV